MGACLSAWSLQAFFNSTNACSGAVMHSGDNKSGIGAGDDEVITIVPQMMPPSVIACVLVCTNQSGTGEAQG